MEDEPVITLVLQLAAGPKIYASDFSVVNDSTWSMRIHRNNDTGLDVIVPADSMNYVPAGRDSCCSIDVHQSPERYAATLEMFKGGYPSEITIIVDSFSDKPDYSKKWNTVTQANLAIKSISFEFPLPQHEA